MVQKYFHNLKKNGDGGCIWRAGLKSPWLWHIGFTNLNIGFTPLNLDLVTKKKNSARKQRHVKDSWQCVEHWLTLTALLPTTRTSQWFVSGMAELLSGSRAYVTGTADNTWVPEARREGPGSRRETARSPRPTASAFGRFGSLRGLKMKDCFAILKVLHGHIAPC